MTGTLNSSYAVEQITHQPDWSNQVGADPNNPGGGWCICMWATASLIKQVGCNNVHITCGSTDVPWLLNHYREAGVDLQPAQDCVVEKCGMPSAQALAESKKREESVGITATAIIVFAVVLGGIAIAIAFAMFTIPGKTLFLRTLAPASNYGQISSRQDSNSLRTKHASELESIPEEEPTTVHDGAQSV